LPSPPSSIAPPVIPGPLPSLGVSTPELPPPPEEELAVKVS